MNYELTPYIWPFKMLPATQTPGIHFDDDWACNQLMSYERQVYYKQKWKKADTTPLVIESTIAPDSLKIYRPDRSLAKSITWSVYYDATAYKIYQLTFDISDLAEGLYFIYHKVAAGSFSSAYISEAIHSKTSWPDTLLFTYSNSFHNQDIPAAFEMKFRCEAGIPPSEFDPGSDAASYIDQTRNATLLSGVPFRTFKLLIAKAPGVAPWVVDLLNRIFNCDSVDISGKKFTKEEGAKWEITRVKGYPLIGASLEIAESTNKTSQQKADTTPIAPGIIIAYQQDTGFFGNGTNVQVIDVEQE